MLLVTSVSRGSLRDMGYVTSLFARKMVAAAGADVDARALLTSIDLDPDGPWDPKAMIPAITYYDLLERIAAEVDVTDLPVRTGASMRLDEYGALGLAFKAATTLGASYARVERYARLWTSVVEYELREDPRGTLFILHRPGEDLELASPRPIVQGDQLHPKAQVRLVRTVPLHHIVMAQAGEWHDRLPVRH